MIWYFFSWKPNILVFKKQLDLPLVKLTLQQVCPKPVLVHGVVPPQVQDPALALVELQVLLCLALQPVQVTLNGSTACWCIHCSSQFCVISKLAEGALCPFIQIIDEEVKQD